MSPRLHSVTVGGSRPLAAAPVSADPSAASAGATSATDDVWPSSSARDEGLKPAPAPPPIAPPSELRVPRELPFVAIPPPSQAHTIVRASSEGEAGEEGEERAAAPASRQRSFILSPARV